MQPGQGNWSAQHTATSSTATQVWFRAMQTPATSTPHYRSPVKEQASKQHDDHSSSSSDQLTYAAVTPYGRCPLIPCMPDLKRGSGSVTNQHPISELAGLHAALSREGVQVLHSPTQRQPHQQYWQHLQQPQLQPPSPLRAGLHQHRQHSGSKQHAAQPKPQLFEPPTDKSAELQRLGTQIHTITATLQGIACREGQQLPSTSSGFLSSRAHGNSTRPSALADPLDARASLDIKLVDRQVVERLRDELSTVNDNVTQRLRSGSSKAAATANAQKQGQPCSSPSSSSRHDAAEHGPPPPSPLAAALQQQQQELLGLAGNSKSASLAASLTQQLAMSQGLQRLLQPRQQQLANGQDLAQAGLQQLQDITEVGQLLLPALAAERLAVAENQQKLSAVSRVLQAYPEYKDPSALQGLVDSKRDLEVCCEALKRELQAKDTAHRNTLNVLRESTSTPRNKRLAQLHQENITLQQQLMSRDAQLQRYEQELRALRSHAQGSNGELSPVSAEGQRYDDVPPARQVNRTLWGAPLPAYAGLAAPSSQGSTCGSSDGGSSVSGSAGSSCSCTPSSSSSRSGSVSGAGVPPRHGNARQQPQQRQPQQIASAATDMTTQFERQRAAGRAAIPQLQQQLNASREPKPAAAQQDPAPTTASLLRQPGSQVTQPSTGDQQQQQQQQAADAHSSAMQALRSQLQQQFEQQAQQEAAMRASAEATFKRQIERERLQHECTQQRCKLLEGQTQQLQQQLEGAQAQQAGLAAQVKQLQQQLELERHGNGAGSSGGAALTDPQQQLQLERSVSDLQDKLSHAQQEKKDLQQRVEQLMAEGQVKESEMKKRANQLLIAEQALMDYGAQKEQLQGLKRRCQELQEQLSTAQQAQAAAEGSVQECRRQLAAAAAERSVLMDRIRQLADRASFSESLQQQVNRSAGGNQGPSADPSGSSGAGRQGSVQDAQQQQQQQQLQQELSAACAELNQQVVVLRGRLADSEGKEERLQVANAALQERLGRLQADLAAREAAASSSSTSGGGSTGDLQRYQQQQDQLRQQAQQLQQQEQQLQQVQQKAAALHAEKQQLEQQVGTLQEQLAAATAAADADSSHSQQEQQQEQPQSQQEQAGPQQQQEQQHQQQEQQQQQQQGQEQQHDVEVLQAEVQELQLLLEDRTQELQEWQIHADALEKDLEDLKAQVLAADGLQEQLQHTQAQLAAARAQQQQLQGELSQARDRAQQLDYELHGVGQERSALRSRVDALTSELSLAREGAADLRLRLEAFTGPTGPQARVRQLEASVQNVQRKYEAAESRAASAASRVSELTGQLGGAEDTIVALEGHITLLEEELAKYTQLPQ